MNGKLISVSLSFHRASSRLARDFCLLRLPHRKTKPHSYLFFAPYLGSQAREAAMMSPMPFDEAPKLRGSYRE